METITIDVSSILYYVLPYYIIFNIFTLILSDSVTYNISNILCILNPFREFSIKGKNNSVGTYLLVILFTLIPYTLIMLVLHLISKYNYNIIW